jgi:hypothetical protein
MRFAGGEKPQHPAKIIHRDSAYFAPRVGRFAPICARFRSAVFLLMGGRLRTCLSWPIGFSRMKRTA